MGENLELKGKKNCNPSKTGHFLANPFMERLEKKQPVPKSVISKPTRPWKG